MQRPCRAARITSRKFCASRPVQRPRKCNQSVEVRASHPAQRPRSAPRKCNQSAEVCASHPSPQRSALKTSTHGSALHKCKQSVNPLLLLTGHGIIVSSRRVVGCGSSSSDPPFLFRFPRFSIKVSTCCLEEVPGLDYGVL